jgi:transcriptional/translational regulatory protein YebC/TACO1
MSGHNKWSKIKHKKAATDGLRSKLFSKHAALIAMEARKAGGNATSPGVVAAVERAKKDSMPKDNIERAIAKGSGSGAAALEEVIFEAFGPGGAGMIITAVTDNNNRTAPLIKHAFVKAGYQLGAPGSAMWAFTKANDRYIPTTPLEINDSDGEKLASLIEALLEQDDVHDIFTTTDTQEEVE